MSYVQDERECPQCKSVCRREFNCRTTEEIRICSGCGRREEWYLLRDENGYPLLNEDGAPDMQYLLVPGYGSAYIQSINGLGQLYSISEPVDEEFRKEFYKALEKPDVDKENSYLSVWDSVKNELITEFGKHPITYEEYMKEQEEECIREDKFLEHYSKESTGMEEKPDLELEVQDLLLYDTDAMRIKVPKDIFDTFVPNTYIRIRLLDKGEDAELYVMVSEDDEGIIMDWLF